MEQNRPRTSGLYQSVPSSSRRQSITDVSQGETLSSSDNTTIPSHGNATNLSSVASADDGKNETTDVPGIGGQGGVVYDVNRLKRNLLQETVAAYKQELYVLLQSPTSTESQIAAKLAALVQGSAVRTTTDSNLLDGTWTLAYQSKYTNIDELRSLPQTTFYAPKRAKAKQSTTTTVVRLEPRGRKKNAGPANDSSATETTPPPQTKRQGGKEGLFCRKQWIVQLEAQEDDNAHVIDSVIYAGGLLEKVQRSDVRALTRTSFQLQKSEGSRWYLFRNNKNNSFPNKKHRGTLTQSNVDSRIQRNVRVVYIDNDLAVLSKEDTQPESSRKGEATELSTFLVYTKNPAWIDSKARTQRKVRYALDSFRRRILKRKVGIDKEEAGATYTYPTPQEEVNRILQEINASGNSTSAADTTARARRLRVLKLGDVGSWDDSSDEDDAWDGQADPFVHLTPDERQEMLKTMNVRQINRASNKQLNLSRRERWLERFLIFGRRRRAFFKKPKNK